eukprot:CAMPEP_0176420576 /NCGR_PEP_ID=MMETSP0127-20121128/8683_1 /TAXON_ID=938130 /ORGANISM="Platyophrya macrostoma, Strain WH" /LENGTH=417 /DNA_ID=CAMNT_0017801187 /DNA_START=25 /DNA_END=1278 /DNA_ORIENTATION=+
MSKSANKFATLRVIDQKEDSFDPFLVTIKANLYTHKEIKNKKLLHLKNSHFDWIASNTGRSYQKTQSAKYAIGVYSKDTNEIKLMPAEQIFNLKQYPKDYTVTDDQDIMFSHIKALQQKQILVEELGNKKSKKILKNLKNTMVKDDNIASAGEIKELLLEKADMLEKKLEENPENPVLLTIESKLLTLPEFDVETKDPSKIYNIGSIWDHEHNSQLNTAAFLSMLKKQDTKKGKGFITKYLMDWSNNHEFQKNKYKVQKAMVLNFLLKLMKKRNFNKPILELAKELEMPAPLVKEALDKFFFSKVADNQSIQYQSSKGLEAKLVCYIIVLALSLNDYEMDAEPLRVFMKIEDSLFIKYCTEIGCNVKKSSRADAPSMQIKLEAPLKIKLILPKGSRITTADAEKIKMEQILPKEEQV